MKNFVPAEFIRQNTGFSVPPHVPEIRLHLADDAHDLWHKTEDELEAIGLQPPFWAFAWAGGQGLSRYILDHPELVAGKHVLDFATGSGIVAIAAKLAGAQNVVASDIDPFCEASVELNSKLNNVELCFALDDLIGNEIPHADIILAGDVFYDREMASQVLPWFHTLIARGKTVLIGDPGRSYLPAGLKPLATYNVPVARILEDAEIKKTTVWQILA